MALQSKVWTIGDLTYQSWSNAYQLRLTLTEQSVDTLANTSAVDYKLELISGGNNRFTSTALYPSLTLAGKQIASSSEQYSLDYNSVVTLLSGSTTIAHGNDGSLSLAIVAKITPASNKYGPPDMTISESWALTSIARASTIAATDANIGAVTMIAVTRRSPEYTHSIQYAFGNLTGYLTDSGEISATEVKFTAASIAWTLPDAFYAQIPSAKSGVVTLKCRTYSSGAQVGSAQSCTFTATATESECKPDVSGDVADINPATIALTGSEIRLIRYHSTARATISATAKKSASIAAKQINGQTVTGSTLDVLNTEVHTFTFAATDSRGYTTSATMARPIVPYVRLTCNADAKRTDQTSGNATLTVKGNYFNGSFGAVHNALTLRYRIADGEWITVTPTFDGDSYSASASLSGLTYTQAWEITVEAVDKLETASRTLTVLKGVSLLDIYADGVKFNVPITVSRVAGLSDPAADADAVNKGYVDMALAADTASATVQIGGHTVPVYFVKWGKVVTMVLQYKVPASDTSAPNPASGGALVTIPAGFRPHASLVSGENTTSALFARGGYLPTLVGSISISSASAIRVYWQFTQSKIANWTIGATMTWITN